MNILSKEAPLEVSIKKMKKVLEDVGCEVVISKKEHPLQNCHSLNLNSVEAPSHIYSNGKGSLEDSALASALGEYIERLQTNMFFSDFYLPKRKHYPDEVEFELHEDFLSEELYEVYDPDGELLGAAFVDFNSDSEKIISLPFKKFSTNEIAYFPVNILHNLYVSNGLSAGNTPKEAQVQALSEIYERYAKFEIIRNGYALAKFPQRVIEPFTKLNEDISTLRKLGYIVEVLDASLGGVVPVTAISLINPKNSTLFVSFGAHPILEVSLERTMTELMQGRSLDTLDDFETPTFDMSIVSDSFNLESHFVDSNAKLGFAFLSSKKSFEFSPWKYDSKVDELEFLTDIASDLGKEIYLREYDYLGFYSCQVLIPSISEVYPIDDLIYNNKNSAKAIRDMVLNFSDYDAEEILDTIISLDDSLSMEKYIGVIFKNNFTMAEFKAHLSLLMDDKESALEFLQYSSKGEAKVISELIHMELESQDYEEYEEALFNIFSKQSVEKALRILNKEEHFIDITLHNDYCNMLAMYDRLAEKKELTSKSH
ncbi:MAG: YcaO-like family protein [Sulfurimonas sp.]|uniref:YcaO-like family protein n=1 Tax=Sulfurimonas sp. TaxID=2022749 RepID=UPI002605324C|nr:YcaO-like family protein [Sulfurimonas sp.]MDD3475306.1 YcaO-like family protein [Sulfurimonas sp.]